MSRSYLYSFLTQFLCLGNRCDMRKRMRPGLGKRDWLSGCSPSRASRPLGLAWAAGHIFIIAGSAKTRWKDQEDIVEERDSKVEFGRQELRVRDFHYSWHAKGTHFNDNEFVRHINLQPSTSWQTQWTPRFLRELIVSARLFLPLQAVIRLPLKHADVSCKPSMRFYSHQFSYAVDLSSHFFFAFLYFGHGRAFKLLVCLLTCLQS